MNEPQQSFNKALKIMMGLGVLLPFLVASYTCQLLCTSLVEKALTFSAVFLFVFLIFWIVARTIVQFLDE
ncbi:MULTISPECIES: hypothetical protein [Pontibacter]|uniref:Uncharacterized protein n=1 Tax=Pontibacter lucknowensis TaxID=1077936 RepID=A0A1N7B7Y2_9BACT|nr:MULTISPECIES: hypothetical protein [Pontibacter]EJF10323.1 hypothetical protein O71_09834 [Pontibacter sp. BAB1700]SIR47419.1 hypothetical protein SAMN05421545_3792 [Pontibacter lucknowensis]